MVRAWYYDESDLARRCPHLSDPPRFLDLQQLKEETGVVYYKINTDDCENDELLNRLRSERGYGYHDTLTVTPEIPKVKPFSEEHLHPYEEINLCLEGSGYFDTRSKQDGWIRVEINKGDMIVIPAGIYHRFTLDQKDYIKANRYFIGDAPSSVHHRGATADQHNARKQYVQTMNQHTSLHISDE